MQPAVRPLLLAAAVLLLSPAFPAEPGPAGCAPPSGLDRPASPQAWEPTWAAGFSHASAVATSPNGTWVAVGGSDVVHLVDAATQRIVRPLFGVSDTIFPNGLAWSPDGSRLAAGGGPHVAVWDVHTGQRLLRFQAQANPDPDRVNAVAWSHDGTRLATGGGWSGTSDNRVKLWNATTGELLHAMPGHTLGVTSVAWSPLDLYVASGAYDTYVRVWNPMAGGPVGLHRDTAPIQDLAWHPSLLRLAGAVSLFGGSGMLRVYALAGTVPVPLVETPTDSASSLAWSPEGDRLVSGGDSVRFYEGLLLEALGGGGAGGAVAWSAADAVHLAGAERVWAVAPPTGGVRWALHGPGGGLSAAAGPDGRIAAPDGSSAFVGGAKELRVWDPQPSLPALRTPGHVQGIRDVAWSPDGAQIATGGSDVAPYLAPGNVKLWDGVDGRLLATLEGHPDLVFRVAFHPDGTLLASAGRDATVRLWDLATGATLRVLEVPGTMARAVAWSPDGARLAAAADGDVRLWDTATWSSRDLAAVPAECDGRIAGGVAFSPDGARLATAGGYWDTFGRMHGEARLWDAATGGLLARYVPADGEGSFVDAAWEPEGQRVALASADTEGGRVWDLGCDCVARLHHPQGAESVRWGPAGEVVTAAEDQVVRRWAAV